MTKDKEVAVSVKDLHKSFKLPHDEHSGIKQAIINTFRRNRKKGHELQRVLKGLEFEIEKGDFFGIVGRNGSGKSTLLKTLAGIYSPDKGLVQVNGTLVPFIELGVGFNPELTGRENVFLNGALLGFSRDEIEKMYTSIVEFAELERFMDQKLKNYSSGMQVRLAFSIAIRADGDILLLDEVLAVGDEAFQRKCEEYFASLKEDKKTVILVTHSMDAVRKFCNKAMMIHEGEIIAFGSPEDVANEYSLENINNTVVTKTDTDTDEVKEETAIKDFKVELLNGKHTSQGDTVKVRYSVVSKIDTEASVVTDLHNIRENYDLYCFGSPLKKLRSGKVTHFEVHFDMSQFNNMNIIVHSSLRDQSGDLLTFANEKNSPQFIFRRDDYQNNSKPQPGAIFKNGKNAKWQ